MRPITFAGVLILVGFVPVPRSHAHAQSSTPDVLPGSRIRVTTSQPSRRLTGTLVGIDGDSLRLAVGKRDTVGVPVATVTRLEESRGRRANYAKGALIGGGVGLALGLGVGLLADFGRTLGCESSPCTSNLGEALAIGGLAGAGVGAGVGALLAGAFPKDRWQPVARPGRSVGLGVRLRF